MPVKSLLYTETLGVPDGSTCDSQGFVWNAVWRDGERPSIVNLIDPKSGEVAFTVKMPEQPRKYRAVVLVERTWIFYALRLLQSIEMLVKNHTQEPFMRQKLESRDKRKVGLLESEYSSS